ncbi:MAG: hypothetical protein AAGE43_08840 [Pseudomonadota bacterium]
MKKAPFKVSLILAGVIAAGSAAAEPYPSWSSVQSDDDRVSITDAFKDQSSVSYNEETTSTRVKDIDTTTSVQKDYSWVSDIDNSVRERNDLSSRYSSSDDFSVREDNSVSERNDLSSVYTSSDDYSVREANDHSVHEDTAIDFQIATPTMTSHKFQDQDAGHQADTQVYGAASGHSVGVEGGTNLVSAGNDETVYYGPALVNTNTNQLPQNNLFIQGHSTAPISQANTFAGRDMGPKGVFAPIGNTSAQVGGSVGVQAGATVDQSGDAANSIADPMSSVIRD